MKYLLSLFLIMFFLAGCNPAAQEAVVEEIAPADVSEQNNNPMSVGETWTVIDETGGRVEWKRQSVINEGGFVRFEVLPSEGAANYQKGEFEVVTESPDRVTFALVNSDLRGECKYEGRIWTETNLDSYEALTEDSDPSKRPNFYRIITGTYNCENMTEAGAWLAKINE